MPTAELTTHTLDAPGATLTYDIRRSDASREPALLMIGSPMGASGFGALADGFPVWTVVTYDPRGSERSKRTDGAAESTPEEHADDLHRLISAVGGGPVDVFASSGGAVNALALVARHPEDVRTLVAHEPPSGSCCRTARPASPPPPTSTTRICAAGAARQWPSSSRSSRSRVPFLLTTWTGRLPTQPCSGCQPRTTARATTRWSVRT